MKRKHLVWLPIMGIYVAISKRGLEGMNNFEFFGAAIVQGVSISLGMVSLTELILT